MTGLFEMLSVSLLLRPGARRRDTPVLVGPDPAELRSAASGRNPPTKDLAK